MVGSGGVTAPSNKSWLRLVPLRTSAGGLASAGHSAKPGGVSSSGSTLVLRWLLRSLAASRNGAPVDARPSRIRPWLLLSMRSLLTLLAVLLALLLVLLPLIELDDAPGVKRTFVLILSSQSL